MSSFTAVAWLLWLYVIWSVNPLETNFIGFGLFYATLFLAVLALATLLGFFARFVLLKKSLVFQAVAEAFRQSFLFGILIVTSLVLIDYKLFSWLNILSLALFLSFLEFLTLSLREK